MATGLEKAQFHSHFKENNRKECSNYHTVVLISHASKIMLKILQARLQQYVNWEIPDIQAGFRKGRRTRDQIANVHWIIEKRKFQKKKISISASLTMLKPLTVWITTNCGEFLKGWEYLTSKKHVCMKRRTVRSRLGTMERFKIGKAVKAVYCHTAYLTSVWIHHAKCQAGCSTSWNQHCQEKHPTL